MDEDELRQLYNGDDPAISEPLSRVLGAWMRNREITRCETCGAKDEWLYEHAEILRTNPLLQVQDPKTENPIVKVVCGECASIRLLDARMVGLIRSGSGLRRIISEYE